jgi:hypothetical protein
MRGTSQQEETSHIVPAARFLPFKYSKLQAVSGRYTTPLQPHSPGLESILHGDAIPMDAQPRTRFLLI